MWPFKTAKVCFLKFSQGGLKVRSVQWKSLLKWAVCCCLYQVSQPEGSTGQTEDIISITHFSSRSSLLILKLICLISYDKLKCHCCAFSLIELHSSGLIRWKKDLETVYEVRQGQRKPDGLVKRRFRPSHTLFVISYCMYSSHTSELCEPWKIKSYFKYCTFSNIGPYLAEKSKSCFENVTFKKYSITIKMHYRKVSCDCLNYYHY